MKYKIWWNANPGNMWGWSVTDGVTTIYPLFSSDRAQTNLPQTWDPKRMGRKQDYFPPHHPRSTLLGHPSLPHFGTHVLRCRAPFQEPSGLSGICHEVAAVFARPSAVAFAGSVPVSVDGFFNSNGKSQRTNACRWITCEKMDDERISTKKKE